MQSPIAVVGLAVCLAAQDPATEVAAALLRGDGPAAARAAGTAATPALRARLQAATLPAAERAAAMLAVARVFPRDPEADRALFAGAAAVLVAADRGDAVPELRDWHAWEQSSGSSARFDFDGRQLSFDPDLGPSVLGLREAVAARRAEGGDAALLAAADRWLSLACVTKYGLRPVRVPTTAAWQRPDELLEPLALRLVPCAPGWMTWDRLDTLAAPLWSATLPATGAFTLPAVPKGDWLLEASSTTPPWRGVRRVQVSDVEAVALAQDGCIAGLAFGPQGLVAGRWQVGIDGTVRQSGDHGASPFLAVLDPAVRCESAGELRLQGESGPAWLEFPYGIWDQRPNFARHVVHGMVDRPLYRPGEMVQGRLVVRACAWDRADFAASVTTAPAAGCECSLFVQVGGVDGELILPLRADANGLAPFSFVVPAEAEPGHRLRFLLALPGEPERTWVDVGCGTAAVRRQALQLDVEGPERVAPGTAEVEVVLRASWASGGPAAGIDVQATAAAPDSARPDETLSLRTDAEGRTTVRVPVARLAASTIDVQFQVAQPGAERVRAFHRVRIEVPQAPGDDEPGWRTADVPELDVAPSHVGGQSRITVRGRPGLRVLVVVGRSRTARLRTLVLGADGRGEFDEPVLRADWPRLDVVVATVAGHQHDSAPVRLQAERPIAIEVPERCTPGDEAAVRVRTGTAGALVTIAVVDERLFAAAESTTTDPDVALRPDLAYAPWQPARGLQTATPQGLLASLLHAGRIATPNARADLDSSRMSAGGAGGRIGEVLGSLRTRFQPTAHFVTVVADADGVAATTFRLPDDLTQWRVTAAVVSPNGGGGLQQAAFASRQPLALEPVLPRGARAGDAFELPLLVDRAADAVAPNDVAHVRATATADVLELGRDQLDASVAAGRVVVAGLPVRAKTAGTAQLALAVQLGPFADRSERPFVVSPDRVAHPLVAVAAGTGDVALDLPAGASPDAGVVVDVMQGGAEAWRRLEAELAAYPYGCAEQTLSRLLPYFAMVRAQKELGQPLPAMDDGFARRLRAGLQQLRRLQDRGDAFAFWPGHASDLAITGLVLHGCALLREGGLDLATTGLELGRPWRHEPLVADGKQPVVDAAFVAAVEHRAGQLRLHPGDRESLRVLQVVRAVLAQLPPGLCARLGLAWHAAGDLESAMACRQRLREVTASALAPDGFPGEDPLAVQALTLEFDLALQMPVADRERAVADLLLACLRGADSTYGRACALSVLARLLPRAESRRGAVVLECGTERRAFELGDGQAAAVRGRFERAGRVRVQAPAGMALLVRVTAARVERASDHAAWASPLQVERRWGELANGGDTFVPIAGAPRVGRNLVLEVTVRSPVPMRRVVVDCPLPTGFEVASRAQGLQRFDDRVAFACDVQPGQPTVLRVEVVPTLPGRFVWPPASAAPMYVTGSDGGCAGDFVDVLPAAADVPTSGLVFAGPEPEAPPEPPPDPFADACAAIEAAYAEAGTGELPAEAERQRLAAAAFADLERAESEPFAAVGALRELVDRLDDDQRDALVPERMWRSRLLAQIRVLLVERTKHLLAAPWPKLADAAAAVDRAELVQRALWRWPPGAEVESWIARWWRCVQGVVEADELLRMVDGEPHDGELCAALREVVLVDHPGYARRAFEHLSPGERRPLPPAAVLDRLGGEDAVLQWAMDDEAGRAEVLAKLGDAKFVQAAFPFLNARLPIEHWGRVPLGAFRMVAERVAAGQEDDQVLRALVVRVTAAPVDSGQLLAEFAATPLPVWRFVLGSALRARLSGNGGDALPTPTSVDARGAAWSGALALRPGAVREALALVATRRAMQDLDLDGDREWLARFVAPLVVGTATPSELHDARDWLGDGDWQRVWARLAPVDRLALLGKFERRVPEWFVPATADEADALWQFHRRTGDVDGAIAALLASPIGADLVLRHLASSAADAHAAVRTAYAESFRIEASTLLPKPGNEGTAAFARLARLGLEASRTPVEAERLRRARALRGL